MESNLDLNDKSRSCVHVVIFYFTKLRQIGPRVHC
jgi:hypothetical protein